MIDFPTRQPRADASTNMPPRATAGSSGHSQGAAGPHPSSGGGAFAWQDDGDVRAAAARATARWVAEQDALADEIARRARAAAAARSAYDVLEFAASSSRFAGRAERLRRFWRSVPRRLPGDLGGLVRLFICVSLSMALIAAVLPLIDRHG